MVKAGYKVFLELGGDLPADRICALLQAVDQLGSLNRAAPSLKCSYRHAWGLIKKAEERLGQPLLAKHIGGTAGGGAELTDAARSLLGKYHQFRSEVEGHLDAIFPSDGQPGEGGSPREDAALTGVPAGSEQREEARLPILVGSTIGPIESGIMPALEGRFYQETGILVRHIAAGSGQALSIAREGRVDLVLSHAPELEAGFVQEGFGVGRYPLMYNDFVLLGPSNDPALVRGGSSAAVAFRRIAEARTPFVSRGDQSGTHIKETELWARGGVTPTAPWYRVYEQGAMGSLATLRHAEQVRGYTLVDRATYLKGHREGLYLSLLLFGDPVLRNDFALVPVSPKRYPRVSHLSARRFVDWATGPVGQKIIREFGVLQYGQPLFFPLASSESASSESASS